VLFAVCALTDDLALLIELVSLISFAFIAHHINVKVGG